MMKKRKHGAFVRNIPGIYNSTWTDMFIEKTYMRMWHGHTGAIGVATDYHQMAKWAHSFALSGDLSQSVRSFSNAEQDSHHTRHKEEAEGRIKTDQADRMRDKLDVCIGVCLSPRWFTREHCPRANCAPRVNAANAVSLGHRAMENFKGGWPDSLYCPLGKLDVSMDVKKNHMLVGRNVSMTRNSSRHLSLVYLQDHERSTSMMCWPLSYLHIHHWCSMKMEICMSPRPSRHKNTNHKWLYPSVIAQSQTLEYMMCLHFSGLSPGRPANCVSTWTP